MAAETDYYDYRCLIQSIEHMEPGEILFILGDPHTGKTRFWNRFCQEHDNTFSLSFKGYDISHLPSMIDLDHPTWPELLSNISQHYEYIIIDDADCGKNADSFWETLNDSQKQMKIVLIGNDESRIKVNKEYEAEELSLLEPCDISDALDINGKQTKELICITGGYPEIMREYKQNKAVEDTIRELLEPGSAFRTLAPTIMEQLFSTVETYNTILYAISQGNNSLTEIAKHSGMKYNACLEYLKKMIAKRIVRQKESQNGHKEYYITNSYIYLWYSIVYPRQFSAETLATDDTISEFDKKLREYVYPRFFRDIAIDYLSYKRITFHRLSTDEKHQDVLIDGVNFDYVGEDHYGMLFLKCGSMNLSDLKTATETMPCVPFPDKIFVFMFTNKTITKACWEMEKQFDNVHFIQEKSLLRGMGLPG